MTKEQIVKTVAEKNGWTQKETKVRIQAVIDTIKGALIEKEDVKIVGFGTLSVVKRAAKVGRNINTNEVIEIPETNRVKFKVGKTLADVVAQLPTESDIDDIMDEVEETEEIEDAVADAGIEDHVQILD
jgi:DNA-binding protein HU-beta